MRSTLTPKALTLICIFASSTTFFSYQPAKAGDFFSFDFDNIPAVFALGIGTMPDYVGSDDYTLGVAPYIRYTLPGQERYVQLLANELTINILNDDMFRFGPLANYRFGRDDDIDDEQVRRMMEIDDTIELGAFADIVWILNSDKRQRFVLGAKVYQDVGDESDGFRANFNARYWHPVAKPIDLVLTAGFYYQNDKYSDHYFGVNADNVGTSALPYYTVDGGLNEVYGVAGINFYMSKNWLMSAGVRCSAITGDPADSPIVDQRGDLTQWIAGVGVGYILW